MHLYLYDISRTLQPVQSPGLNCYKLQVNAGYCSDIRQSSGNHAPKSVIIHTSIACMPIKTGVGVNCNNSSTQNMLKNAFSRCGRFVSIAILRRQRSSSASDANCCSVSVSPRTVGERPILSSADKMSSFVRFSPDALPSPFTNVFLR